MNNLVKFILTFSLGNRIFIIALTLLLSGLGIYSYLKTPLEAFPDVTNTQITIITQWPGRSAEEIEKFVTIPIEVGMNAVQKKTDVRTTTLFGLSVIKILFEDNVDDFFARQQVNNQLATIDLPNGVSPEVQPPYGPTGEIYRYTLKSNKREVRELKTLQDWVVEKNLRRVQGVADIVSFGGEVKTFEVVVNPKQIASYDIVSLDVYDALAKNNLNVGGDVITKNGQAYVVRGIGIFETKDDIENVIIDFKNGLPILVKHVAEVKESCLPRLGKVGRDNEDDVLEGIVVMRKGENPGDVIKNLNDKVAEINEKLLPPDTKIVAFYNRETLINYATHTVTHNLVEGIVFVTLIVFLFLADWRTTVTVSVIIPLSLLFAFICLKLKGMNANLLSMGAIDFGIIVDGAVVMIEAIDVVLDKKGHDMGMNRYNKMSKLGLIKKTCLGMGKSIFFAKLIILCCLLPIFTFEKVEGKMFSPLAYTLGFALMGSLFFTLTLVPVMSSYLLNKNVGDKTFPFIKWLVNKIYNGFEYTFSHKKKFLIGASIVCVFGLMLGKFLGSEFLPQLNEGAIYVRASLPMSISLEQSSKLSTEMRKIFMQFKEVKQVMSQTGRPNDGTDPTGFYNVEFHVDIFPQDEWKRKISKEKLIEEMKEKLAIYPGTIFNFSQPIMDNVEEAASGVKGSIAVKIFGDDLTFIEKKSQEVYSILSKVEGIEDLGILKNIGQPELRIKLDQAKLAMYGLNVANCQSVIEMAIGGKAVSQLFEGERKFDIRIRYAEEFRKDENDIGNLMIRTMKGNRIPLKEVADISTITGPSLIFRDGGKRFIAVKFSIRGRDMGSAIEEAQRKVKKQIELPKGYSLKWTGDFENQQRANNHLATVVPISLFIVFVILTSMFGNPFDAFLAFLNVPFALIGGFIALLLTGVNFSISAGIGFIALFGICIQNGTILMQAFKNNINARMPLVDAVKEGVLERIRPVIMTGLMAAIGLVPAALSTGIGSETQKPLAIVVLGGVIVATAVTILIFPLVFYAFYRKIVK